MPFAASCDALFSVSSVESSHSDLISQGRESAHNRHLELTLPGLFHDLSGESQFCYLGLIFMNRVGGFQSSALPTELPGLGNGNEC